MIDHITFANLVSSRTDVKSALYNYISDFICVRSVHDVSVNVRTSFFDVGLRGFKCAPLRTTSSGDMVTVHNLEITKH